MGAIYARVAGTNHRATGIRECAGAARSRAGWLEAQRQLRNRRTADAHRPGRTWAAITRPSIRRRRRATCGKTWSSKLAAERLDDRRNLLGQLDAVKRKLDRAELDGVDKYPAAGVRRDRSAAWRRRSTSRRKIRGTIEKYDTSKLFDMGEDQPLVRHAALDQPAGPADAARPPAVRGRLRLRHRLRLRLGHARQRQQPQAHGQHGPDDARRSITPWPRSSRTCTSAG